MKRNVAIIFIYISNDSLLTRKEKNMKLSQKQVIALKRKRGERNLTIDELANEVGTSRFTISRILHNGSQNLTSTTVKKVNDWIIDQYTTIN